MSEAPKVLIEDWLPIETIGIESRRERGYGTPFPAPNRLHVWWARRPLLISRAAIIGGLLPEWTDRWPQQLKEKFPDEATYFEWFSHLLGIRGDPVQARKLLEWAAEKDISLKGGPYGYPRAFTINPAEEDLKIMGDLLEYTWGTRELTVLDPFAGGGSIPLESLRYGFTTIANDLNPVAATILKATLEYPARFGPGLADDIKKWGNIWAERVEEKLALYFPKQGNESIFAYLWARTVACPTTGKPVPLSPNWWLSKGSKPAAIELIAEPDMETPLFVIRKGPDVKNATPDEGTVSRGVGRSPWTGETVSGDYIKAEAQAGRMGQLLYAVAIKKPGGGFDFRTPTQEDLAAIDRAEAELERKKPQWTAQDLIPSEEIGVSNYDRGHRLYGTYRWSGFFSSRQQLSLVTSLEELRRIEKDIGAVEETHRLNAIMTYLSIALDKSVDRNNFRTRWVPQRKVIASTFERHNFAIKWTFAEFDAATNMLPWSISQVLDAYAGIATMIKPEQPELSTSNLAPPSGTIQVLRGTASSFPKMDDNSVHNITVDPPYYDNVQYAELADFFYVWLKRSVGYLFPEFFTDELTNKDDEAVANPARFDAMGRKKKQFAEQDYENKMAAAFREMHRVLHPDGVLTVMFTHKRVEAWDTLASALIGAGFTIKASWPVHTEFEHSLHQAKKNAAASTILLVCRKRTAEVTDNSEIHASNSTLDPVWWEDIQGRVRRTAREKAIEYVEQGINGVDLYISTFGPTLSVISEHWPVLTSEIDPKTGDPLPLRPETALDLAREEVIRLRKEGLLAGKAIEFDPITDWTIMAWDAFQAEQFPYDEARKLALALGLEMDDLMKRKRLAGKKGQYVILQQPQQRRKRGMVDPDAAIFEDLIDAIHTAMLIYDEDGAGACDVFLQNRGLKRDTTFKVGLQALINAIPRTKIKDQFVRPEADVLDRMRLAFYADELTVPPEEVPPIPQALQLGLFDEK